MTFLELAAKRSSIRAYKPDPVPEELLAKVLEAGRIAPSAANKQPWHFIVLREESARQKLQQAYPRDWFGKAPAIIVVCTEPSRAWVRQDGKNYGAVDGAIAMDHMTLCAADLGLGTCWIGAFDPKRVRVALGLPEEIEPLAMTPLGFPEAAPRPKVRKEACEILHYERW
ncbi:MAG: nitroreductase family protein [Kiritimatiellae bacterium]|nr:nitroreductase family protein [Kiritimatiellia bacterium]